MNHGGYGGSAGRDDDEVFGADTYPEPPVISAPVVPPAAPTASTPPPLLPPTARPSLA